MTTERNHEPSLREVTVEIDGMQKLYEERDKRYDERFKAQEIAVDKALISAKELTAAAFLASKEAIVKAEQAQLAYNVSHNDLIRKMDSMIPRPEFDGRLSAITEKIDEAKRETASLRESRSEVGGRLVREREDTDRNRWLVTILVAVAAIVAGFLVRGVMLFPLKGP
jgi:phosphopantetheinyl transferase (holo-ACP synthase)